MQAVVRRLPVLTLEHAAALAPGVARVVRVALLRLRRPELRDVAEQDAEALLPSRRFLLRMQAQRSRNTTLRSSS